VVAQRAAVSGHPEEAYACERSDLPRALPVRAVDDRLVRGFEERAREAGSGVNPHLHAAREPVKHPQLLGQVQTLAAPEHLHLGIRSDVVSLPADRRLHFEEHPARILHRVFQGLLHFARRA